jgi:hypothetical protein
MTEYSWRNLAYDEEVDIHLPNHFCKRGATDKDPSKPGKPALLAILQKHMVASGALNIERFEEGIPIFIRGRWMNVHVAQDTGHVNPHGSCTLQETDNNLRDASNESLQQTPLQQTPLQVCAGERETSQDGVREDDQ